MEHKSLIKGSLKTGTEGGGGGSPGILWPNSPDSAFTDPPIDVPTQIIRCFLRQIEPSLCQLSRLRGPHFFDPILQVKDTELQHLASILGLNDGEGEAVPEKGPSSMHIELSIDGTPHSLSALNLLRARVHLNIDSWGAPKRLPDIDRFIIAFFIMSNFAPELTSFFPLRFLMGEAQKLTLDEIISNIKADGLSNTIQTIQTSIIKQHSPVLTVLGDDAPLTDIINFLHQQRNARATPIQAVFRRHRIRRGPLRFAYIDSSASSSDGDGDYY